MLTKINTANKGKRINLVYSMQSKNVESSMCNGEWIMKNRQLVHINEEELLKNIRKHSIEIVTRTNIF
ncbi:hypothetical protein [Metabacillus litoralis]|uniref:hypothetical protein n=1 Tax=Metabacillus litoralis TaxID=152268 RepID=UPI002040A87C|nr:hypothetical protein [Metabacillus litoralis]